MMTIAIQADETKELRMRLKKAYETIAAMDSPVRLMAWVAEDPENRRATMGGALPVDSWELEQLDRRPGWEVWVLVCSGTAEKCAEVIGGAQ